MRPRSPILRTALLLALIAPGLRADDARPLMGQPPSEYKARR
jgi:hypothetical protein